ncbi:MAG: hypothetical protein L6R39_002235 [Caloplaca ligustica]|nr:MAG: hypothetical protein L6R39_002235 [Caloplaca ligustica]
MQLNVDLEAKDDKGQTALFIAVKHGRFAAVELLLKASASVKVRDASGTSLLHTAAGSHNVIQERLRCIMHFSFDYAAVPQTSYGPCTLEQPIAPGDEFRRELEIWLHGSPRHSIDSEDEDLLRLKEPLYDDSEHIRVLEKLLVYGFDVNEQDCQGLSTLHLAVSSTAQRVQALLEGSKGRLRFDALDKDGRTPLHYAAAMGRAEIMKLLLEFGAKIDMKDKHQTTTLHFGVVSPACTKLTIELGDLIHARDNFCRTALHYAALTYAALTEIPNRKVRDLLKAGVRPGTLGLAFRTAQDYYDVHSNRDSHHQEITKWIWGMYISCYGRSSGALYEVVPAYHYELKERNLEEQDSLGFRCNVSAERKKTLTVVSDSDEEDCYPLPVYRWNDSA